MNTTVSIQRESTNVINIEGIFSAIAAAISGILSALGLPMTYIGRYYSYCLGREVSLKQTLCLTLAQLAFGVMLISFSTTVAFCAISVAAFAASLYLCKKVM